MSGREEGRWMWNFNVDGDCGNRLRGSVCVLLKFREQEKEEERGVEPCGGIVAIMRLDKQVHQRRRTRKQGRNWRVGRKYASKQQVIRGNGI